MIKIFRGAGVVTPSNPSPPPPYEQLLSLPTDVFGKIPLPPKSFDHTQVGKRLISTYAGSRAGSALVESEWIKRKAGLLQ